MPPFASLRSDHNGLVPCIIQDFHTRVVLMIGYQDEEAWERTTDTGLVHFHSRSRDTLWLKGATSGSTLTVASVQVDCDSDAVLISARPAGPICHTGSYSCFDAERTATLGSELDRLAATITSRTDADPEKSYTAQLLADPDLVARKTLEEAGELAFAAKDTIAGASTQRVVEEAADLLYHTFVLLAQQGVDPQRVADELAERAG
jgi:phosphoribosyl-ATP pyrophosphohydrolase/phosphoribosyl-AMP cyclohydrolase